MKLIGTGNTAEVFEYEEGKVCKFFLEGYPKEYVELEYGNAKEMYRLGLPVPKTFGLVVTGNRNGILYEKVDGKSLMDYLMNERANMDDCLEKLVGLHKEILEKRSNQLLSYKDFLVGMLAGKNAQDAELITKILMLPDGEAVLHGDFHFDNVLMTMKSLRIERKNDADDCYN